MDLALNTLKRLICHKTWTNKQTMLCFVKTADKAVLKLAKIIFKLALNHLDIQ